jgi:hypothetical protein
MVGCRIVEDRLGLKQQIGKLANVPLPFIDGGMWPGPSF